MSKGYQWLSQDPRDNTWVEYEAIHNDAIEAAYKANRTVSLKISGLDFTVDPKAMTQSSGRGSRPIRRDERGPKKTTAAVTPVTGDTKILESTFNVYAKLTGEDAGTGPTEYITGSGLAKLFEDIKVPLDSVDALIVCYTLGSSKPFTITRQEYYGMRSHGCLNIDQVPKNLPAWKKKVMTDPAAIKSFYMFCFSFFREGETAVVIPNETAVAAWGTFVPVFFPSFPCAALSHYTTGVYKKSVTKDVWRGVYELMAAHPHGDFSSFDDTSAWPTFVDDFVSQQRGDQRDK